MADTSSCRLFPFPGTHRLNAAELILVSMTADIGKGGPGRKRGGHKSCCFFFALLVLLSFVTHIN